MAHNYEHAEHDPATSSKKVTVVGGSISAAGQVTVTPLQAWPDPKGYIGLVTITGSLAPAAGNITLDPGSRTGIVGNITLSDPKGFIGLVTVVGSLSPAAGNVTLDPGSQTQIKGNLSISSLIPGTGATNLGKAKADAVGATDTGIAPFGRLRYTPTHSAGADGTYDTFDLTSWHELRTRDQRARDIQNCNASTDFTTLGNDTANLADSLDHVFGTGAITFDKVNGAANTVFAGVQDTITAINISDIFEDGAFVGMSMKIPTITNVNYAFIRLGTDSSNYNEWQWPVADLTANIWMSLRQPTAHPDAYLGNGWDSTAITYVALGVAFNAETDTLTGIVVDHVHFVGGRVTDSITDVNVTSSVNTPNINLHRVGGTPTDTGSGAVSAGTQRVILATDQTAIPLKGNLTLSDSKGFIGLTTSTLGASPAFVGIVTVTNRDRTITGNVTLSDAKTFIGLTTTTLGASPAFIGIVTVTNASIAVTQSGTWDEVGINDSGNSITIDGNVGILGNVTISDSKGFIGLTTTTLGASPALIGIVTVTNKDRTITGNLTLSDAKTFIGLVTIGGLSTVTLADPKGFIGLVTAVTRNAGTTKSLIGIPVTLSTSSQLTIAVPSNNLSIYVTSVLLNSDATVRVSIKSGVTYLTGNASIGITLNPGGGWVETGSPDAPVYISTPSASINVEKFDMTGTKANLGGKIVYYTE